MNNQICYLNQKTFRYPFQRRQWLIAVLPQLPNVPYCDTTHIYTPLHVLLLPAPIIAIACMLAIRNANDNFGIKTELVSTFIIVFISSTMYYATTLFKFFPIVDTYFGGVPFLFLGGLIFQYFSVISPLYRAYKHTHQVSEPSKIQPKFTIDQALENPTLWAKLQQQIIKDFAGENAEFINDYKHLLRKQQAVDEFKRAASLNPNSLSPLSAATSPTLIHDAICKIIQNYVIPLSPLELNISSATRAFVLEEQKKSKSLSPAVLEPVYREVVRNIESNALPRLLENMKNESHPSLPRC
ncbi:hypothetical protein BKA69DRAFT_1063490 [Paraphysoderma sedebokerense]|nr:hypothetical protein BKA69DRAFT_1063490 [Paraphysoderma sedebokerense]